MCRLLGYVADQPTSAAASLGTSSFEAFTSLSAVHGDGWGMAWQDPATGSTRTVTSAISAADDPAYPDLASRPLGRAGLVHLRWATDGLEVEPANTHPFADGDRALAHNGSIAPISELESLLTATQRERLAGTTDSERYFRFVLQCIEEAGDEREGVVQAVEVLRQRFPRSSLNALLLTPRHLFAVHVNTAATTPLDDLRELFDSEEAMPPGHVTQYFDMAYRVSPTSVHVVSSGLTDDGWTPVPPDCVLAVDTAGRHIEILALAAGAPAQ